MARPRRDDINTQQLIINLARAGMTNVEISRVTGIARSAIQRWLAETPLGETVAEVRKVAIMLEAKQKYALNKSALMAARKLLKKQTLKEKEIRRDKDGNIIYETERTKEIAPSANVVQFVLSRTDPQNWGDAQTQTTADGSDEELTINIVDGGDE